MYTNYTERDIKTISRIVDKVDNFDLKSIDALTQEVKDLIESVKPEGLIRSGNNSKMRLTGFNNGINKCNVRTFDLPAGYTCPCADKCKGFAIKSSETKTGRTLKATNRTEFVCFAVKHEVQYTNTGKLHFNNLSVLAKIKDVVSLALIIYHSVRSRKRTKIVRIHYSGDFYSLEYYVAWLIVARLIPDINFFGYTKVLPYITEFKTIWTDNIRIAYSYGSIFDQVMDTVYPNTITAYVISDSNKAIIHPIACYNPKDSSDYNYIMRYETSFYLIEH